MNNDKVLKLAREARLAEPTHSFNQWGASDDALERFAALVEREVRGDAGQCPDKGPWWAGHDEDDTVFIESDDFKRDVRLYLTGCFEDTTHKFWYAGRLAAWMNASVERGDAEPVASAWMKDGLIVNAFARPPLEKWQWDREHWSKKGYSEAPLYLHPSPAVDAEPDANRYRWLKENSARISWNPARFNEHIVDGFAAFGTGYLGYSFEQAIDLAMQAGDSDD